MKKYKDIGIYDFSDYAEEITGKDLIKINGGSSSCNGSGPENGGVSAASGGSGSKGSGSSSIGASSGSCGGGGSPSVPSGSRRNSGLGSSTSGSGSGSAPSSNTGSCGGSISSGTPSGPTGPSSSDVPEYDLTKDTEILKKVIDERLDYDLDLQEYVKNDPRFNELLNNLFSDKMRSLVGTPYLFGGKNLKGIDCSGTITYALEDLCGIDLENYSSSEMSNNKCPYVKINKSVNTNDQGKAGMLNFYIWNSGEGVKHVNSGVGKKQEEDNYQVVDATEGAWMVNRNSNSMQKEEIWPQLK